MAVTYYWDKDGLKVLRHNEGGVLEIYKGHLFTRYNTRMKLGLNSPIDIVKHYFKNNSYAKIECIVRKGHCYCISFSQDSILLGELYNLKWMLWRTFVSRDLIRHHQQKKEKVGIRELEHQTLKAFVEKKDNYPSYSNQLNKLFVLTGRYNVD
jgi:hypothetical protein